MNTVKDFINSLGDHISHGRSHKIFENPSCEDTVIKMGDEVLKHARVFKNNEDFCPIVYKIVDCGNVNENHIIIEKLYCDKSKEDLNNVFKVVSYHEMIWDDFFVLQRYTVLKERINKNYLLLFERMREIVLAIEMKDIHARNFGYDKNGKLKALDL
jgi:hypothetical protein